MQMDTPLLNDEHTLVQIEEENNNETQAIVVAAPRDVVIHVGTESNNENRDVVATLPHNVPNRIRVAAQSMTARRVAVIFAAVVLVTKFSGTVLKDIAHIFHGLNPPLRDRVDRVMECVDKLTDSISPSANSPYADALSWFLEGPGKYVDPPTARDCVLSSEFAVLFAIIVIRGSLNVTTASWHRNKAVKTTSDMCKWKRMACDDSGNIVSLHLSHGDFSGTIPSEISSLRFLKRIELYKNFGITGPIPTEIGSLSNLEYLHLHQTSLSGTIPSELGKLSKAKEIFIDDTKLVGNMPSSICRLRSKDLSELHVDCGGDSPPVTCDKACCRCYNHPRNHTSLSFSSEDTVDDLMACDTNGTSSTQCLSAVISTGEHCVYCTDTRPNVPEDDKYKCLTPSFARHLREDVKQFKDMHCDGFTNM